MNYVKRKVMNTQSSLFPNYQYFIIIYSWGYFYFIYMVKISYNVVLLHTFSQWLVQWYHVDLHPVKWQMM